MVLGLFVIFKGLKASDFHPEHGPALSMSAGEKLPHLDDSAGYIHLIILSFAALHGGLTISCLFFHSLLEQFLPSLRDAIDSLMTGLILVQLVVLSFLFSVVLNWALLSTVINPTLMGYLIMIVGVCIVVRVMVGKMGDLQKLVDDVINSIANQCLEAVLETALSK